MNLCFLKGKIISEIEFNFTINTKNISIATFEIELLNKSKIKVKAYNELADYCYQKLKQGNVIFIQGYLDNNMHIIVKEVFRN